MKIKGFKISRRRAIVYLTYAVYETSFNAARYNGTDWIGTTGGSWYNDASYLPRASGPWFSRGGYFRHSADAGPFNFNNSAGVAAVDVSFRPGVRVAS